MTPFMLQEELVTEIKTALSGLYFEDNDGKQVAMNVYNQSIPEQKDDTSKAPVPYAVVKILSGVSESNPRGVSTVRVLVLISTRSSRTDMPAYLGTLEAIERILIRFGKNKETDHFYLDPNTNIEWALSEENAYPYSAGGIDMVWDLQPIREENDLI